MHEDHEAHAKAFGAWTAKGKKGESPKRVFRVFRRSTLHFHSTSTNFGKYLHELPYVREELSRLCGVDEATFDHYPR